MDYVFLIALGMATYKVKWVTHPGLLLSGTGLVVVFWVCGANEFIDFDIGWFQGEFWFWLPCPALLPVIITLYIFNGV